MPHGSTLIIYRLECNISGLLSYRTNVGMCLLPSVRDYKGCSPHGPCRCSRWRITLRNSCSKSAAQYRRVRSKRDQVRMVFSVVEPIHYEARGCFQQFSRVKRHETEGHVTCHRFGFPFLHVHRAHESGHILGCSSHGSKPAFLTRILQTCPLFAVPCCTSCRAAFLLAPVSLTARRHSVESSKKALWNRGWGWLQGWPMLRDCLKGEFKPEKRN